MKTGGCSFYEVLNVTRPASGDSVSGGAWRRDYLLAVCYSRLEVCGTNITIPIPVDERDSIYKAHVKFIDLQSAHYKCAVFSV